MKPPSIILLTVSLFRYHLITSLNGFLNDSEKIMFFKYKSNESLLIPKKLFCHKNAVPHFKVMIVFSCLAFNLLFLNVAFEMI